MAELVAREEVRVSVEFHAFALQEEDDMEVSAPFPEERVEGPGADLLTAYDKRLDFDSAGHTHEAALTAEVWSSEPSVAGDSRLGSSGRSGDFFDHWEFVG